MTKLDLCYLLEVIGEFVEWFIDVKTQVSIIVSTEKQWEKIYLTTLLLYLPGSFHEFYYQLLFNILKKICNDIEKINFLKKLEHQLVEKFMKTTNLKLKKK